MKLYYYLILLMIYSYESSSEVHIIDDYSKPESHLMLALGIKESELYIDELPVTLIGNIVEYHGDDIYTFQDESGTIVTKIETKKINFSAIPTSKILIKGKVDTNITGVKVDVEIVTFL
ncbi:NirD/YgiW/YdeI family stress tolerance protein [Vibrio mediterranei]|uniref:NirD/YgiW/YdeI family stress tolerance protein n=1 Tax=Vibrio mediterranei TaxID=689 RepID=UPI0038CE173F